MRHPRNGRAGRTAPRTPLRGERRADLPGVRFRRLFSLSRHTVAALVAEFEHSEFSPKDCEDTPKCMHMPAQKTADCPVVRRYIVYHVHDRPQIRRERVICSCHRLQSHRIFHLYQQTMAQYDGPIEQNGSATSGRSRLSFLEEVEDCRT